MRIPGAGLEQAKYIVRITNGTDATDEEVLRYINYNPRRTLLSNVVPAYAAGFTMVSLATFLSCYSNTSVPGASALVLGGPVIMFRELWRGMKEDLRISSALNERIKDYNQRNNIWEDIPE